LPVAAGWVVLGLGASSAVFGIVFAFAQNDLKRLLAYCSVENVGIILIGLGGAFLAEADGNAAWGRLVLAGALWHVWNHGAFKSLLFFASGSVLHATGTREMSRLGGLWRAMPWTTGLFALGAVAVSGLPPLNGFVSEWLVYLGLFNAAASRSVSAWATTPAAIMLAVAGAMAMATFVKAAAVVFLGAPRTKTTEAAHECGPLMRAPMVVMAMACGLIGLAPVFFWPAMARAMGEWNPAWITATPPVSLPVLGSTHLALTLLAPAAGAWLWRKVRANGLQRYPTWDCGYARPAAHMQYTGGSFAGIVAGWFYWLLRPHRKFRRPRGLMPTSASRIEHIPETVLERVIVPAGNAIMQVSASARRLQHGRLQDYILYMVVGLIVLAIVVFLGGNP
jgi:hydrogenase-4 component B